MSDKPKILAFAGSTRVGSFNKRLVKIAMAGARDAGAEVTYLDLRDYPLPLYDADLEKDEGLPENARLLKDLFRIQDGFLLSAPEYNSSVTGVLKNTLDWLSRPVEGRPKLECFAGKTGAIMSASTGALGGLRGLVHVRAILTNLKLLVLPYQISIPRANNAFTEAGDLADDEKRDAVGQLARQLTEIIGKLKAT
jgi:chromate reductase